jgi:hypothetical protein
LIVPMREIEVAGVRHPEQSEGKAPDAERLRKEVEAAREDLELRTAELETAQARLEELEQKLRLIHESRIYRLAFRMWRIRARTRALVSRRRARAPRELIEAQATAEELEARAATEELDAQPTAEQLEGQATAEELEALAPQEPPPYRRGDPAQDAEPLLYYGSRGVRTTDQETSGPLHAVLLMGGMTESQLDSALRALDVEDPLDGEPLVVTDCDALKMLDSAGHLYEYIPPREDWERHLGRNGDDYDDFVRRRLASIAGMYGLAGVPPTS